MKWAPRLLDQKQQRVDDLESCLEMLQHNKNDFFMRYVTMDETWIHHYTPESNRPKRTKTQMSGKVLAFVFWDAHSILFINYLEKGKTIISEYYIVLFVRLKEEIAKKRP